jgi:hypothetical protein
VDGGLDHLRYGWAGDKPPKITNLRLIDVTSKQLYTDWNSNTDHFGLMKGKGRNYNARE